MVMRNAAAALLLALICSHAVLADLLAVMCHPECAWYVIDPTSGDQKELSGVPEHFQVYIRPGVGAAGNGRYFWSFPQSPSGLIYTYESNGIKTGTVDGFSSGVVSLAFAEASSMLLAIANPGANFLARKQLPSGSVERLVSLGKYNVSGHEYVSALDDMTGKLYVTGDDLTAHSAGLITIHNVFGPATGILVTSSTYSGWAMLRMAWCKTCSNHFFDFGSVRMQPFGRGPINHQTKKSGGALLAMVYDFASTSKLVALDPTTGLYKDVTIFEDVIQRAELAIEEKTQTAYVLAVPSSIYTIDLASGKIKSKAPISPSFGAFVVSMLYV